MYNENAIKAPTNSNEEEYTFDNLEGGIYVCDREDADIWIFHNNKRYSTKKVGELVDIEIEGNNVYFVSDGSRDFTTQLTQDGKLVNGHETRVRLNTSPYSSVVKSFINIRVRHDNLLNSFMASQNEKDKKSLANLRVKAVNIGDAGLVDILDKQVKYIDEYHHVPIPGRKEGKGDQYAVIEDQMIKLLEKRYDATKKNFIASYKQVRGDYKNLIKSALRENDMETARIMQWYVNRLETISDKSFSTF